MFTGIRPYHTTPEPILEWCGTERNTHRVVLRASSARGLASIVIACAGHTASHSLHAMHLRIGREGGISITFREQRLKYPQHVRAPYLSSPDGYRRSACSPRNRVLMVFFSNG